MGLNSAFSRFRDAQPQLAGPSNPPPSPFAKFRQRRPPTPGGLPSIIGNIMHPPGGTPEGGPPMDWQSLMAGAPHQVAPETPNMFPGTFPNGGAPSMPPAQSPLQGMMQGQGGGGLAGILARLRGGGMKPPTPTPIMPQPPQGASY